MYNFKFSTCWKNSQNAKKAGKSWKCVYILAQISIQFDDFLRTFDMIFFFDFRDFFPVKMFHMKWRLQMQSFHHQMSSEDEWKNRQTFGFALHRRFHSINTVNTYMGRRIHPQIHWPKMKEKPYFTDAILIHSYCDSDRAKVNHLKKVHILKFCNNKFCNFEGVPNFLFKWPLGQKGQNIWRI